MQDIIKILIASSILFNFSMGLFGPIYAIFVQQIGGNILTASSAWALYTIVLGVLTIAFGKMEDRLDKRKMFVLGRIMTTVGIVGYLFVAKPIHLFIVQFILGIAGAIKDPTFDALFSRALERGKESSTWAYQLGLTQIFAAIAALVGGIIATIYGFRVLFGLMAVVSAASVVVSAMVLKENR